MMVGMRSRFGGAKMARNVQGANILGRSMHRSAWQGNSAKLDFRLTAFSRKVRRGGSARSARRGTCTLRTIFVAIRFEMIPAGYTVGMVRVLVTLSPRMYRQAVALSVQRGRPGLVDVRIAPPEAMEKQLASFRPHLLVHNDPHGESPRDSRGEAAPIPKEALEAIMKVPPPGRGALLRRHGRPPQRRRAPNHAARRLH